MPKRYFPGLNTLRLYAAICVVLVHIRPDPTQAQAQFFLNFVILTGYDAVSLFFVLSGFLISYLLLVEKNTTHDIAVKDFLIRRCLRIWPVYFLVILLEVLTRPASQLPGTNAFIALALFSPHIIYPYDLVPFGHFWSIGVEEWFYFCWPMLMKRFRLLHLIAGVIIVRLVISTFLFPQTLIYGERYVEPLNIFWHSIRFECMAIGAFGAWLLINRHWFLRVVYRLQLFWAAAFALLILLPFEGGLLFDMVFNFVFMGFILNISTNPRSILKLEHRFLRKLGNVTYGIYMYQGLTLTLTVAIATQLGIPQNIGYYLLALTLTFGAALLSYRFFEQPFLSLKTRFRNKPEPVSEVIAA